MKTNLIPIAAVLLSWLPAQDIRQAPSDKPLTPVAGPAQLPEPSLQAGAAAPLEQTMATATARTGALSDRVLFDRPRADGPLWALGHAWKASFDGRGCTVIPYFGTNAPRNYPLRLELAQASVGGERLALVDGVPVQKGDSVRTVRGALAEVIDARLDSLEQSFVFETLPNRGAIAVEVRIDTELAASPIAGGLRFANELGHVDYTKAIAVDAGGRQLPLDIVWTGTAARMEIPAAFVETAQLPLVLDPILNSWFGIASGQTLLQHDSDVATIQASSLGGRTLIIYQRQWSGNDQDCWGVMFDGNLGLIATDFNIDFTTEDWIKVAVAGNNYAQNFLVVSEVRTQPFIVSIFHIGGRTVAASGTPGGVFDIEREGVVGTPGNNFHPDVGSDPYFGVGRYTVVFNKRLGATSDIYARQVTSAGGMVTTNAIALDVSSSEESRPSISKSCGQSNGPPANWIVTWQRTYSAFDQDVYGRFVNWNGALPGGVFPITTSTGDDTAPSGCSPIDVEGTRYWPVAYEFATSPGQPRDVVVRIHRADGSYANGITASSSAPSADDFDPEIDSDGTRFVVVYTDPSSSGNPSPEQATIAWLPGTNSFRVESRSGLITSALDTFADCNICADYSGGGTVTPRYVISFTEASSNTFRLAAFAGHAGNTSFFTTRASQCGNLSITPSGSSVIGQTVRFDVSSPGFSGTIFGFPGFIPLNVLGCNCWQGVDQGIYTPNPLVFTLPLNPVYVGIDLSVQGYSITGTNCLGFIDLSDTVDFKVR